MVKLAGTSHPFMCPSGWQKLLLWTDGSPHSQGAIKAALALAQASGQKVSHRPGYLSSVGGQKKLPDI